MLQLREKLRRNGLSTLGRKEELVARVAECEQVERQKRAELRAKQESAALPEDMVAALHTAAHVESENRASRGVGLCEPRECARIRLACAGYKWTLSAFMLWLARHGHDARAVWRRLTDLVVKTVLAGGVGGMTDLYRSSFVRPRGSPGSSMPGGAGTVYPEEGSRSFELLGFDVILDSDLQVRCSFLCLLLLFFCLHIILLFAHYSFLYSSPTSSR